jgi:hypothetical protein|tara:strand:+ start:255 stop:491 length:237 start_codon:yes stop_codon:yes gene_type:complete
MRHKMITLCPETYKKARNIKNFSRWIRWVINNKDELDHVQYLIDSLEHKEQLINDIIEGKKRFVEGKGWIKNMYKEEE